MDKQQILDYMDTSIASARICQKVLKELNFAANKHEEIVDSMVAARATFWKVNQKELEDGNTQR